MSDEEMDRLCHQALGYELDSPEWPRWMLPWNPRHDDAQAMALVKRLKLWIDPQSGVTVSKGRHSAWSAEGDYNRAIVECVAKIHGARTT